MIESQSLCLYHVFRVKEASSYIFFAIEETVFYVAAYQLICQGPIQPQHIFDYMDVIRVWNWRTIYELKSQYRYVWFKYDLGQKYHTPQVQPGRGLNS